MLTRRFHAGLLLASLVAMPALAQESSLFSQSAADDAAAAISAERVAAGVRQYPARVLRSLLEVAQDPLVLRQLADEPGLLERPENLSPPVSTEMHAAIRELSVMPAIVFVAADHPAELEALRTLYANSPVQMEENILQLRLAYDQAELSAAAAWQDALQRDPVALKEYTELVTAFCKAQREAYGDFPCVQVSNRDYYYACLPNDAIIFYALEHAESSPAMKVIEQWWQTYGPYERDARILDGDAEPFNVQITAGTVAAMPPEQRSLMWHSLEGDEAGGRDLVPMIMQPPADQTPEAYYARAVAEHARLWTPEPPPEEPEDLPAGEIDQPADVWLDADQEEQAPNYGLPYVEQPVDNVVYDDGWNYAYGSSYAPTTYSHVRYVTYHDYYAPIAVYYCGYPIDWPVFYHCEPSWLVRFRICGSYLRCGNDVRVYRSRRSGSHLSLYFGLGGWDWDRYDHSHRRGFRSVVRVGNRYYYRCARNRIARALHHNRTHYGRTTSRPPHYYGRSGANRSSRWARYGNSAGRGPAGRVGRSFFDRSGRASASRYSRSRASLVAPRRSSELNRRSSLSRRSNVSSLRSPSGKPAPIVSPRRSPSVSSRFRTFQPRSSVSPRRDSSPRRNPIMSPRSRTNSRPKGTVSPRPGAGARPKGIAPSYPSAVTRPQRTVLPRPRTSFRPKSAVSPRPRPTSQSRSTSSPRPRAQSRPGISAPQRPRTLPSPKSTALPRPRLNPRPKSSVSSTPRASSRPKTVVPSHRRTTPKPRSASSPRPPTSSRPKSAVTPRPRSAPRPKSTLSPRPRTSPGTKGSASSRRSAPRRSPSASSRSRSSSRPKSSASLRRSSGPRHSPRSSTHSRTDSKPKRTGSSRRP